LGLQPCGQDAPDYARHEQPQCYAFAAVTPINSRGGTSQKEGDSVGQPEQNVHSFSLHDVLGMGAGGFLAGTLFGGFLGFLLGCWGRK
jgi:hypothetical protein